MVLHNVTDDAKLIKVPSSSLGTEGLLECDLNIVDVVSVPGGAQERVTETQDQNVLYHLLAEVVVDTEQLVLLPIRLEGLLKLAGASEILSEGFLDLDDNS
jgi:hypothetical protein